MTKKSDILLIKTTANWADEMDLAGFALVTKDTWTAYKSKVKEHFKKIPGTLSKGVGSNQDVEFENIKEYLAQAVVKPVTLKEVEFLTKTFKIKVTKLTKNKEVPCFSSYGEFTLHDFYDLEDRINDSEGEDFEDETDTRGWNPDLD